MADLVCRCQYRLAGLTVLFSLAPGGHGPRKSELASLLEAHIRLRYGAHLAAKPYFTEINGIVRRGLSGQGADQGRRHREVGRRLIDADATCDIQENIATRELQAA